MTKTDKSDNFYGSMNQEKPGEYPFTHGIYEGMYTDRLWTMRQYAGFASAEQSNSRYKHLLEQGVMGLSVAFDLPTQTGYDSDHELAEGEIGKVGVPISSLADIEVLFKDIPLDKVSISMTINSTAIILLAFILALAEKQNISFDKLRGTIQNDILKEYIARGTYIYPPNHSLRIVTDIFDYCGKNVPNWNTISISGYHIREAGATAVQELGFTFSNAITYVQAAIESGLNVNEFGRRISFFFNSHNNFFEEIAKFRAARRMWASIMKNRFNATDEKAMMCRFHTQTAGSTLTAQQIDNNTVRTTLQATAAVLGGTQSLHTNSRDEALSLPTEESATLALRTQQIIAHESGVANTIDPLSGSYFIEELTNKIQEKSYKLINKVDDLGGAISAIESNFQQSEIANSAFEYQKKIDNKEQFVIGVNKNIDEESIDLDIQEIDKSAAKIQLCRLEKIKNERDEQKVKNTLKDVQLAAINNINLLIPIITAVKEYATLGEISDCLRSVFGEYSI